MIKLVLVRHVERIWNKENLSTAATQEHRSKLQNRSVLSAALSAFESLCLGAAGGQFSRLNDRDGLWQLLVVITTRKVIDHVKRRSRQKRGGGRVLDESAFAGDLSGDRGAGLDHLLADVPDPAFVAMAAEECRRLLAVQGDESLRQIALWRMDGETSEAIAKRLWCSLQTVDNKIIRIRMKWEFEVQ
jgi:DNA-directed RNA polymerase specialized sigma24 family protein